LQPITQRVDEILTIGQVSEYDGRVWIDTINGTGGTVYPVGTPSTPVFTLTDALIIAANLNFERYMLRGSITLTSSFTDSSVEGLGVDVADIVLINGQDVSGTVFTSINVSGSIPALTADLDFDSCRVGNIIGTGYQGTMRACGLEDNILFAPGQSNLEDVIRPRQEKLLLILIFKQAI